MKRLPKNTLLSLMSVASLSSYAYPVFGADTVEQAKTKVQESESLKDKYPRGYAQSLFNLAQAYHSNGEDSLAETTFRQSLPYYSASNPNYREGAQAAAILNWAQIQICGDERKIDYKVIDSLTLDALKEIDKVSEKLSRIQTYEHAILLFTKTNNHHESLRCKDFILESCANCESNADASSIQIRRAAMALYWIAERVNTNVARQINTQRIGDSARQVAIDKEFQIVEQLMTRATKLCDRKTDLNNENAFLHSRLGHWYAYAGKNDLANEQRLLAKKFVPPDDGKPRMICGRVVAQVSGAGAISGACGMG